jgi:hypothetical protein
MALRLWRQIEKAENRGKGAAQADDGNQLIIVMARGE